MANCPGSGKSWVKKGRKTQCSGCSKTIAQLGGHPNQSVPSH